MNISYTFRPSYLITAGILILLLGTITLFSTVIFIYNDFLSKVGSKDQIILIIIVISEPVIIWYAIYLMIKGRSQIDIQFSETNFKEYKNHKLEISIPVEWIESVIITHGTIINSLLFINETYKKIEIALRERDKFQLKISGKKRISEFLKFIELLRQYCDKNRIKFEELFNGSEKPVSN